MVDALQPWPNIPSPTAPALHTRSDSPGSMYLVWQPRPNVPDVPSPTYPARRTQSDVPDLTVEIWSIYQWSACSRPGVKFTRWYFLSCTARDNNDLVQASSWFIKRVPDGGNDNSDDFITGELVDDEEAPNQRSSASSSGRSLGWSVMAGLAVSAISGGIGGAVMGVAVGSLSYLAALGYGKTQAELNKQKYRCDSCYQEKYFVRYKCGCVL